MNRSLVLALFAAGVIGCESTGVGNPDRLSVTATQALSAEPGASDPKDQLPATQLSHALLAIEQLRWLPCDQGLAPVIDPGPFVIDLVAGTTQPPFSPVAFPNGGFCGLDAPLTANASSAVMQGRSVFLSGTRKDGASFVLYAAMSGTIHLRPQTVTAWTSDNARSVVWALRPRRWVTPSEIDAESTERFGARYNVVAIDANRRPLLYYAIRNRLGSRSTLHTDLDGNGVLDADDESLLIGQGLDNLD